jgi:hypothetical protein
MVCWNSNISMTLMVKGFFPIAQQWKYRINRYLTCSGVLGVCCGSVQ